MLFYNPNINKEDYIVATYWIKTVKNSNLAKAAWDLAIGQSVGNPNVRNEWEAQQKNITVVEDFQFDAPKTKSFQAALSALGISDKKSLWVLGETNKNVFLSGRNLTKTEVLTNDELNTYKIMNAQHLVLAESAVAAIEANLSK